MAKNLYFSDKVTAEQQLYENIVIESLKMYGQDVYYLPRDIVNEDRVFGDDVPSRFNSSYKVEMYIENTEGFDGEGDLFTKFGVEIRDQATFVVARKRWADTVQRYDNDITVARPAEGDLIYLPLSNSLFQIMHVEHEQPFYQLSNLPTYKLRCELFEYNDEDLDTGIDVIDDIERSYAYAYNLTFTQSQATASVVRTLPTSDTLASINLLSAGEGYTSTPGVTFSNLPVISDQVKFGNNSLYTAGSDENTKNRVSGTYSSYSHRGYIQMWVYLNNLPDPGRFHKLMETGSNTNDENLRYRTVFCVNENGALVSINLNSEDDILMQNQPSASTLTTNTWHHVRIAVRGSVAGESERTTQVYIDGSLVFSDTDILYGGLFSSEGYNIGGNQILQTHPVDILDGYIDDFSANTSQPAITGTISVPGALTGEEVGTTAYENFNTPDPDVTVNLSNGKVSSIDLNSAHNYFRTTPVITLDAPQTIQYTKGETVQQTLASGVVVSGEVANWKVSTGELKVIHVGADDGEYHTFITTRNVVGVTSGTSTTPSSISEDNQISENEQNDDFETIADGFLDFTETNPFGDPNES